jgi:multiple sugar transport system permease protein
MIMKTRESRLISEIKRNKENYLMIAPFGILFTFFTVIPVLSSLGLSFTYFNMLQMPSWRGWLNYIRLFLDDPIFTIAVKNTLIFAFITGPISYMACILFAWLINELPPKIRAVMTLIFYAPSISGSLYMIWAFIFSGDQYGLINGTLMKLGLLTEPIQWLQDPDYNLKLIIVVQLWLSLGAGFLAFIAGLQGIDKNLYEAAAIDGVRNRFQELLYVTLPSMGPQLLFGAVMQISASFAVSDICAQLAGFPSTDYSAHTVVLHMLDYGTIRFEMGYASAIATVLFITMITTNAIIRRLLRKFSTD